MAAATKTLASTTDKAEKKPATSEDDTLRMVLKDFNNHWTYVQSSWHPRWEDNYKLYNNERIKRGYLGISDTFVPMTFSTVETLVAALFATKPKFEYLAPQDRQDQDTTILNALTDFYWDKDQWSNKIINTGRGFCREGTAVDYMAWNIDHPILINVPIRDFFIDTYAFELDERTTKFCGRRYVTTLDDLEEFEVVDLTKVDKDGEPTGDMKPKYKNLDKLKTVIDESPGNGDSVESSGKQPGGQMTDKEKKDMLYGTTLPDAPDQVEVIEYWTVDRTISIANRTVVIEDVENYFKAKDRTNGAKYPSGILPFADARNYVDGSLFYAKSDVDFIADQQEDLNDFSNQEKDAVSFNLNQQKTLDPKYKHLMAEIENIPGEIVPVEAGAYVPVPTGVIPPDAFNERMNIKNEIRETTASDQVLKGVGQTAGAKQTATEVNAQMDGAGRRIGLRVTQLENGYFHRLAKIMFHLVQLYVTEPMMVQIIGREGASWETFDPAEFKGQYDPRVQLDISIQQKNQQQQTDAANMLKAFLNDPNVDQRELTKIVLQRGFNLDPDEVLKLLVPNPNAQDPNAPADPNAMMQPPMPGMMPGAPMPPQGMPQPGAPAPPAQAAPQPGGAPAGPVGPVPGTIATPGGQVHETADLVKMFQATTDPAVRNAILGMLQLPAETVQPLTAVKKAATELPDSSQVPAGVRMPHPHGGLPHDLTPEEIQMLQEAAQAGQQPDPQAQGQPQ